MSVRITNPILPGFHPDPSICRVDGEYFIATSTFEWFPGVRLHRSRDLVHWKPCGHALTRPAQVELRGNEDSGGVWAPCLTHADGRFWLIYSNVRAWERLTKDVKNYLVTAPSIEGPWSDPVFLNGLGFDPSLFHDDDGRKWLVQMQWNHRAAAVPELFDGIVLQEFSARENRLVGPRHRIFSGSILGMTEGPHLYKRNGRYYLLTAEGGTSWEHAATLARASVIEGPYEVDPSGPLLCARHAPDHPLQKTGHACVVHGDGADVWVAYLCARPLARSRHCPLGRETALARAHWTGDGWLRIEGDPDDPALPPLHITVQDAAESAEPEHGWEDDFEGTKLGPQWQTLRVPAAPDWLSLTSRPGWLRLSGRESFSSRHDQSLVACRWQSLHARATTLIDFQPTHPQQMAGLAAYYDTTKHYAVHVTWNDKLGRVLDLVTSRHAETDRLRGSWPLPTAIPLPASGPVHLAVALEDDVFRFSWSLDGVTWQQIGPALSAAELSDEGGGALRFTGTMIALYAQDMTGEALCADFDYLRYSET